MNGGRHEETIGSYEIIVYSDGVQWHYVVVNEETGWSTSGSHPTRGKALAAAREAAHLRINPKSLDLSRGVKKYLDFHDLDVKDIGSFSSKVSIPPEGRLLGIGKWVTYRSDKWERPKKYDYIHDFGTGIRCVTFRGSDGSVVRVPVSYQRVETLVLLGTCLGFAFLTEDGEEMEAKPQGRKPELYCTPSGRALFVVQDKKQILAGMWGGKLGVESRGIVG